MRVIRELRNGLDHRLETVKVTNFEIQTDGNILSPSIELNHKEVKLPRISLKEFLINTIPNLLKIIETTFAYLAGRNANSNIMAYEVREIPEEKRRYKYVKYCFWSPLGQDGYYSQ